MARRECRGGGTDGPATRYRSLDSAVAPLQWNAAAEPDALHRPREFYRRVHLSYSKDPQRVRDMLGYNVVPHKVGEACGTCHNGEKAFSVKKDCKRCHKK